MVSAQEQKLMSAFGKRLHELRRERGLTQEQLASAIDTHVTTVAFIEPGKKFVRLTTLRKLAATLNVEIMDLFKGVR